MSDIEITLRLSRELIERAHNVGLEVENEREAFVEYIEKEIRRRESGQRLETMAEALRSLPPELKPTPDAIDAEIRAYWAEKTASSSDFA